MKFTGYTHKRQVSVARTGPIPFGRPVYRVIYANIVQRCVLCAPSNVDVKFSLVLANPDTDPMTAVAVYWIDDHLIRHDFLVVRESVYDRPHGDALAEYTWAIQPNGTIVDVS